MALLRIKVPRKLAWLITDWLELWVGTENAADLAGSTPAGGTKVAEVPAWGKGDARGGYGLGPYGLEPYGFSSTVAGYGLGEYGLGEYGLTDAPRAVIEHEYRATDKCATLPVGVKVRDACGNVSAVIETLAEIRDPPRGARRLTVTATGTPLQARLGWEASPDL